MVYLTWHKSPCCVIVLGQLNYTTCKWFMPFLWAKVLVFQGSAHQNGVGSLSNTIIRKEIRQHKIVPI